MSGTITMRHTSILAVSFLALLVVPGCSMTMFGPDRPERPQAAAAPAPSEAPATAGADKPADDFALETFDSNHDGQLGKDELEAGLKALFAKTDTSGDGVLSASEIRPINDKLLAIQGGSPIIDWNADGRIDMAEFASQWRTRFDRADINGDKNLDVREMAGKAVARRPRELPPAEFGRYKGKTT